MPSALTVWYGCKAVKAMSNRIDINSRPLQPLTPAPRPEKLDKTTPGGSFGSVLQETIKKSSDVRFSAHALHRLKERELALGEKELNIISKAVDKAKEKGSSSSLLLYGDMALIASVKNRTIVTALDRQGMKDHVFTGIDSAVIIEE
jgi:flagellar operon protein